LAKSSHCGPVSPAEPGPWQQHRLFRIGKQPINASLQAYANVVKPDIFGDVTIRAQIQFLFPK
jgi:hypothetical protein